MTDLSPSTLPTKHGGILIPLDPFRVSHLAAVAAELLVSKARDITDARLVLTRHPRTQLVLGHIEGKVVGDDPVAFWRENADIAVAMSQVLPRQCFMYYVQSAPPQERREAFLVAQRGQVLAADEGSIDRQAPGAEHWPVEKLCEQLRLDVDELASGFAGGPSIEIPLLEPNVDDQTMLMTLAGQSPAGGDPEEAAPAAAADKGAGGQGAAPAKPKLSVSEDLKRREQERAAEEVEQQRRAAEVEAHVPYVVDELGIVACPRAELSEPDLLEPFILSKIVGDLPAGLPRDRTDGLQGKRCDIAIRVDFLSEVFVDSAPLARPMLEERAETRTIGGRELQVLEVLAPRLGYGTLVTTGKAPHVFVSRKPELALPESLVLELLG
ncbi:hypothetical protein [Paraliomyxa miuraensis]|uniref:hypothetical protein n=1 Tax=Paraliomyxa miuraensis TaxID=376150 RepID=UPI0022559BC2|nr:hypothetical protein [Paraliomyxa miuraensis]MCX4244361.1 hypothetical protein [Paraliomyxa miuraensis]